MPARLLSGKEPAEALLASLKPRIGTLHPSLTIVQVGDDPASNAYIKAKMDACGRVGIDAVLRHFPADVKVETLLAAIEELNADPKVSGYIVQLPLPAHLSAYLRKIAETIDPAKDVDGFTAMNLGKLVLGEEEKCLPPATPAGVIMLLDHYGLPIAGRHAVVIGRSTLVGKPLALMFLQRNATVTICHSHTTDLAEHARQADILIAAAGKPGLVTKDMVKPGAVVVDVGITRTQAGLRGDVDFEAVKEIACAITPVPGGIGPMTVACLLRNVVRAKEWRHSSSPPLPSSAAPR